MIGRWAPRRLWGAVLLSSGLGLASGVSAQQDSLDLATALRLARERSPALLAASAAVNEAEGGIDVAGAARLPRVNAEGLYLRYDDAPGLVFGPAGTFAPLAENNWLAGVWATVPVYTAGRSSAAIRSARATARAAELTRSATEVEITAAVAHAHDDALLARAMEEVAERSTAVLRRAVEVAQALYEEGTAARLDVLRAETRLSSAEAAMRAARDARIDAAERLAPLIGLDPSVVPVVVGRLELDTVPVDALNPSALSRRAASGPAARTWRAAADAAEAMADAARAASRPTVTAFLGTFTTRPELITGDAQWGWELLGGVSMSWPFFDGGAAAGEAAMAQAEAERARAQARRESLRVEATVRIQRRALARALEDATAGGENERRAERALAIAEERYRDGIGLQLEVLEAEAELSRVRAERLRAVHAYRAATIELRRALGLPADAALAAPEED